MSLRELVFKEGYKLKRSEITLQHCLHSRVAAGFTAVSWIPTATGTSNPTGMLTLMFSCRKKKRCSQKQSSLTPAKEFESLRHSSRAISTTASPGPKNPTSKYCFADSHHDNSTRGKGVAERATKDNRKSFSDVTFETHFTYKTVFVFTGLPKCGSQFI